MLIRRLLPYGTVPASLEEVCCNVGRHQTGLDSIPRIESPRITSNHLESPRIRGGHAAGHPDLADHPVLRLVLAMLAQAYKAYQLK